MNLKDQKVWLVWKVKSEPRSALTGERKGWQRNLTTYVEAAEYCKQHPGYKLGVMFNEDCGYFGLDIDGCRNPETGDVEDWAAPVMMMPGFANVSVSGTGIKLILKSPIKMQRCVRMIEGVGYGSHDPQIELFTSKYFALTLSELPKGFDNYFFELTPGDIERLGQIMQSDVVWQERSASDAEAGETSPEELRSLLEKLDVTNYSSREDWIKILQASHHATGGSAEGLEVFMEWSAGDPDKFSEEHTIRDWGSQDPDAANPVTIATIIHEIPEEQRPRVEVPIEEDFEVITKVKAEPKIGLSSDLMFDNNRNELFIATKFVEGHHNKIRFVAAWQKWVYWDGARWVVDPTNSSALKLISDFVRGMFRNVPEGKEGKAVLDFLNSMNNAGRISNVARLARSRPEMFIDYRHLDAKNHLFNTRNLTIDLHKMEFREQDPDDLCTLMADVEYVEGARCETWVKVLNDVFAGDQDLIGYVQKLLGYCLSGENTQEIFPVAYGDGCNGKSTITELIQGLFGDYAASIPSELFDSKRDLHPTYIAKLFRKRFAAVAELESDVTLSEATVKKVTSRDTIEARRMREDPWEFIPTHTSWLSTNHKPRVKGVDKGIWRRIKLIPFNVDLTKVRDNTIPEKLSRERSGVLNWLLEGYSKYKAEGMDDEPEVVKVATSHYRDAEDSFKIFIDECIAEKEGQVVTARQAFDRYVAWGGRLGIRNFYARMESAGFEKGRVKKGEFRDKVAYENIMLIQE